MHSNFNIQLWCKRDNHPVISCCITGTSDKAWLRSLFFLDFLALEDGTDTLSPNKGLPFDAA
jgi:hypothetical protein